MDLFYTSEGQGPTLLLTHGWTMTHRFFERQQSLSSQFRLLLWDLPGHGDSEKRPEGYSIEDCSHALRELLEHQGIDSVIGLGWSMGAEVLWDYVRRFGPKPFTQMVNVDSLPWGDPDYYQVPAVERAFLKDRPRAARKFIKQMFFQTPEVETLDWMLQESLKTPTPTALRYYAELAHCDYRQEFRDLGLPIYSLLSRQSSREAQGAALADLNPKQQIHWFENSGHMPFWEEAEKFNETLISLLK